MFLMEKNGNRKIVSDTFLKDDILEGWTIVKQINVSRSVQKIVREIRTVQGIEMWYKNKISQQESIIKNYEKDMGQFMKECSEKNEETPENQ